MTLNVELVSPEALLYEGEASMVVARTSEGEIGIQTGHVPFVGTLLPGHIRVHQEGGAVQGIAVHGGFIEVSGTHLTILSDVAELAEDIDVARAQDARSRAESALATDSEDLEAAAALRRAHARLAAAGAS